MPLQDATPVDLYSSKLLAEGPSISSPLTFALGHSALGQRSTRAWVETGAMVVQGEPRPRLCRNQKRPTKPILLFLKVCWLPGYLARHEYKPLKALDLCLRCRSPSASDKLQFSQAESAVLLLLEAYPTSPNTLLINAVFAHPGRPKEVQCFVAIGSGIAGFDGDEHRVWPEDVLAKIFEADLITWAIPLPTPSRFVSSGTCAVKTRSTRWSGLCLAKAVL